MKKNRITRPIPLSRSKNVSEYFSPEFLSFVAARRNASVSPQPRQSFRLVQGGQSPLLRAEELARQRPDLLGWTRLAALHLDGVSSTVDAPDDGQGHAPGASLGNGAIRSDHSSLLASSVVATELRGRVLR